MNLKGFGTEFPELSAAPHDLEHQASDPVTLLQSIARSLELLARDVLPRFRQRTILDLAASDVKVIDTRGALWRQMIVTVITGTIDVWIQEGASPQSGTIPPYRFTPGGQPFVLEIPPTSSSVSVFAAGGAAATGAVTLTS